MDNKTKKGVSVQEIENFGKKYRFEIFFIIYFLIATLLNFMFFGTAWSVFAAGLGGIFGVWLPNKIERISRASFHFIFKQEKVTKIIIASAGLIVSFFIPPLVFFVMGLMGGTALYSGASRAAKIHEEGKGTREEE